ncbi:MAG: tRNA (adenosine(37)-N6)-dimethylallyltransferase MiaA [Clostridia bacterium]|nr:tRNA (adenosine(37)-N6)-dimethylallyltransferase MiaA [Clostridia bacterium]
MVQENSIKNKVIVVCGPTASGKSKLAIDLAKRLDTEIICADALTVYKNLNVGTAKVTVEEMQGIKHHLIDVADPFSTFSVGDYKELAEPILKELINKGKIPIICGGTGFYIKSLLFDFSYGNSVANLDAREKYFNLAEEHGKEYVFEILKKVDPKSAEKLHFNDLKRVVRALEIYESGHLKSDIVDTEIPLYDYKAYSFDYDRELLYERINIRVDQMIENGLVEEVKGLIDIGITNQNQSLQAIGYKEIYSYLTGETSLDKAIDLINLIQGIMLKDK